MFGEQVPRERYTAARALIDAARSLVVLGSSLAVGSGYRFTLDARRKRLPVAIVTRGWSRADELATIRVDADVCTVLPEVTAGLASPPGEGA